MDANLVIKMAARSVRCGQDCKGYKSRCLRRIDNMKE